MIAPSNAAITRIIAITIITQQQLQPELSSDFGDTSVGELGGGVTGAVGSLGVAGGVGFGVAPPGGLGPGGVGVTAGPGPAGPGVYGCTGVGVTETGVYGVAGAPCGLGSLPRRLAICCPRMPATDTPPSAAPVAPRAIAC